MASRQYLHCQGFTGSGKPCASRISYYRWRKGTRYCYYHIDQQHSQIISDHSTHWEESCDDQDSHDHGCETLDVHHYIQFDGRNAPRGKHSTSTQARSSNVRSTSTLASSPTTDSTSTQPNRGTAALTTEGTAAPTMDSTSTQTNHGTAPPTTDSTSPLATSPTMVLAGTIAKGVFRAFFWVAQYITRSAPQLLASASRITGSILLLASSSTMVLAGTIAKGVFRAFFWVAQYITRSAPRLLASASRTTDSTSTQKVLDTDLPTTKSRSTQTDLDTDPPTGHVPSLLASHRQYGAHIASSTSFSATDRRPTSDKNFCDLAKAYIELANIAKEYLEPAKLTKDHFELVKDDIPATTSRRDLTQQLIKDEVTATTSRRNWLQKLVKDDVPATTSRRDSTQQLDSIRRPPSPSFQAWLPRDIGRQDVIKPSQKSQMPGSFPQDAPSSRELLTDGGGSPPTTTLSALGALRSKLDQETLIKAESRDEPTDDEDGADYGSVVSEKPEESEEDVVATKQHTPARKRCAALIQNGKRRCKNRASEGKTRCPQHLKIQNKRVAENVDKWFKKENAKPVASHPPTEPETTQMHSNLPLAGPLSRTARPDQHDYDDHGANKAGSSTVRGQGRKGGSALASLDDDDGDSGTVAASGRPSHEEAQMTVAEPNIANKRAVAEQRWANVEKEGKEALGGV